jgi:single-strand DNA-binding protein
MFETPITLTGWLGSEVSLTTTSGGHQVATFRVASTPRRWVQGDWQPGPTNWFTVKAWRSLAQHAHESLHKGDPVVVWGRLTADVWEREDGQRTTRHVVVATSLGHDLALGTTTFTRADPAGPQSRPGAAAESSAA